ncbi:transglutaminase family protein [Qipengyuania sp. DSG2-2]|uniref:transglutaminase-like domain-containing protein n=1 Tax=Qipengyuania sp. DGS2-2 TaxID=3349631 RepID=UPI0036D3AA96
MPLAIDVSFAFQADQPTDVLLHFEGAMIPEQNHLRHHTDLSPSPHIARLPAQDAIGERVWIRAEGRFEVGYSAEVAVDRLLTPLGGLRQMDPHTLPEDTIKYLFDSRYCAAGQFHSFVDDEFGDLTGGKLILAIHDWVADHFTYVPGASGPNTTALDSFVERRGICRDYSHVIVTLARASGIPARFVSCFAPGVTPQDFHAVAEVFLEDTTTPGGGAWYLVDATGMAEPADIVKIGVGRDAADVSFMTSFGLTEFLEKTVSVKQTG